MVKVISLSEKAYAILKRYKGSRMSFSEAVMERFSEDDDEKKEGTKEMVDWIKTLKMRGKREPLHAKIDQILYGARP